MSTPAHPVPNSPATAPLQTGGGSSATAISAIQGARKGLNDQRVSGLCIDRGDDPALYKKKKERGGAERFSLIRRRVGAGSGRIGRPKRNPEARTRFRKLIPFLRHIHRRSGLAFITVHANPGVDPRTSLNAILRSLKKVTGRELSYVNVFVPADPSRPDKRLVTGKTVPGGVQSNHHHILAVSSSEELPIIQGWANYQANNASAQMVGGTAADINALLGYLGGRQNLAGPLGATVLTSSDLANPGSMTIEQLRAISDQALEAIAEQALLRENTSEAIQDQKAELSRSERIAVVRDLLIRHDLIPAMDSGELPELSCRIELVDDAELAILERSITVAIARRNRWREESSLLSAGLNAAIQSSPATVPVDDLGAMINATIAGNDPTPIAAPETAPGCASNPPGCEASSDASAHPAASQSPYRPTIVRASSDPRPVDWYVDDDLHFGITEDLIEEAGWEVVNHPVWEGDYEHKSGFGEFCRDHSRNEGDDLFPALSSMLDEGFDGWFTFQMNRVDEGVLGLLVEMGADYRIFHETETHHGRKCLRPMFLELYRRIIENTLGAPMRAIEGESGEIPGMPIPDPRPYLILKDWSAFKPVGVEYSDTKAKRRPGVLSRYERATYKRMIAILEAKLFARGRGGAEVAAFIKGRLRSNGLSETQIDSLLKTRKVKPRKPPMEVAPIEPVAEPEVDPAPVSEPAVDHPIQALVAELEELLNAEPTPEGPGRASVGRLSASLSSASSHSRKSSGRLRRQGSEGCRREVYPRTRGPPWIRNAGAVLEYRRSDSTPRKSLGPQEARLSHD